MLVAELLKAGVRRPVTIAAEANLIEAARMIVECQMDFLLIIAAPGGIAGTLSVHDIVEALAKDSANLPERAVATVMRREEPGSAAEPTAQDDDGAAAAPHADHREPAGR